MTPPVRTAVSLSEVGYVAQGGLIGGQWAQWEPFEPVPDLQWPYSIRMFWRMERGDTRVTSVLEAISLPIRQTGWRIDPNGARDEVVEFVSQNFGLPIDGQDAPKSNTRSRDRFSWGQHLFWALQNLQYGHSLFEQVYRRNPADGRFWIRKLAPRPQRSIMKWNVALDGGLVSVTQMPPSMVGSAVYGPAPLDIPINRLVVYPRNMDPGQWIGKSILRPAYKNWLLKDELMRIEAATARRNGMGVPVANAPAGEEDVQQYTDIASNYSAGDSTGVGLPAGATLKLLGVSGNLPDLRQAIEYHDTQIAIGALAHFLNLDGKGGSYALASVQANAFVDSVQTHAQSMCDIAQAHILEDLIDINFGVDETAPLLTFDPIGSQQDATAAALNLLVQAGLLSPDALTERSLRQRLGLPARQPADDDPLNPIPGSTPGDAQPSSDPDDPDSSGDSASAIPRRTGKSDPWRLF